MTETDEVKKLFEYLKNKKYKIIFLHCVSKYPLKGNECNLSVLNFLQKNTTNIVGYSDHTKGTFACEIAVAMGAKIIEKHFTNDPKRSGFDHKISLNFKNFRIMVKNIRNIEKLIGNLNNNNQLKKKKIITSQKRSYILNNDLKKGEKLSLRNINTKRMGKNENLTNLLTLLNKKSKKNIKKNEILKKSFFI
jgi:sialic acid synthase SpsE